MLVPVLVLVLSALLTFALLRPFLLQEPTSTSTMKFFNHEDSKAHFDAVYGNHQAKASHEVLASAAAFFAMRKYEKDLTAHGHGDKNATLKELVVSAAAAEAVHLAETRGADAWDAHKREEVEKHARQQAEKLAEEKYGLM